MDTYIVRNLILKIPLFKVGGCSLSREIDLSTVSMAYSLLHCIVECAVHVCGYTVCSFIVEAILVTYA